MLFYLQLHCHFNRRQKTGIVNHEGIEQFYVSYKIYCRTTLCLKKGPRHYRL